VFCRFRVKIFAWGDLSFSEENFLVQEPVPYWRKGGRSKCLFDGSKSTFTYFCIGSLTFEAIQRVLVSKDSSFLALPSCYSTF